MSVALALGRVIKTFPDSKGLVRSAKVRTKFEEFKRPISKMSMIVPIV